MPNPRPAVGQAASGDGTVLMTQATQVAQTMREPLQRYLRTLWATAPELRYADRSPFLSGGAIHLPLSRPRADRATVWRWYCAAVAHAAAHRTYSPPGFDARGLGPIARALLALLEDARVELLACRELPGLRRLWAPLHVATPLDGDGFEALMLRLARSLIDAGYDDAHPWVRKGRDLFYADAGTQSLALRRPDELRRAASRLGHDIGQMRLQFNDRTYVPGPDYRDDHRWMWPVDPAEPVQAASPGSPRPAEDGAPRGETVPAPPPEPVATLHHYPEWDRLIARLRADWCAVYEERIEAPRDMAAPTIDLRNHPLRAAMRRVLQRAAPSRRAPPRTSRDGDRFDTGALVRARVAQRLRRSADGRVYRRAERARPPARSLLMIDQSASSAGPWAASQTPLLQASGEVAALTADALQAAGGETAVSGFCSNGRHHVQVRLLKDFGEALDEQVLGRLAALRSGQSTRLGAALRHATRALLAGGGAVPRQLWVVSDGQPHDLDVHDPHYLLEDARRAVLQAARQGVRVVCIVLDPAAAELARRIFGAREVAVLQTIAELPRVVARLLR